MKKYVDSVLYTVIECNDLIRVSDGWLGTKEEFMSFYYEFVEDKKYLKRVQNSCDDDMKRIVEKMRNDYKIKCEYFLIGSGARNMVTADANGTIDLDYNINVYNRINHNDCKELKTALINVANRAMKENKLNDVDDSTSSITTKEMWFNDDPNNLHFKMDIAIVTMNNNQWYRLIHQKGLLEQYYWAPAPNSSGYKEKTKAIKGVPKLWDDVRKEYLRLKNYYLHINDHNHPSFICYIEAVNNIYNRMKMIRNY